MKHLSSTSKENYLWVLPYSTTINVLSVQRTPFRVWFLTRRENAFCTQRWPRKISLSKEMKYVCGLFLLVLQNGLFVVGDGVGGRRWGFGGETVGRLLNRTTGLVGNRGGLTGYGLFWRLLFVGFSM